MATRKSNGTRNGTKAHDDAAKAATAEATATPAGEAQASEAEIAKALALYRKVQDSGETPEGIIAAAEAKQAANAEAAAKAVADAFPEALREAAEAVALSHFDVSDVEALPYAGMAHYLVSVGRESADEGKTWSPRGVSAQAYTLPTKRTRKNSASSAGNGKAAEVAADTLRYVGASYTRPEVVGAKTQALSADGQLVTRVGKDAKTCIKTGDNAGRPIQAYNTATRVLYYVGTDNGTYTGSYHGRWQALAFWQAAEASEAWVRANNPSQNGVESVGPNRWSLKDAGILNHNASHPHDAAIIDGQAPTLLGHFDAADVPESVTMQRVTLAELTTLAGGTLPDVRPDAK